MKENPNFWITPRAFSSLLRSFRNTPEGIMLAMRFVGFGIPSILVAILAVAGKLNLEALPTLGVFLPYILISTILAMSIPRLHSRKMVFFMLLTDIVMISVVLIIIQSSGFHPSALNSLYLIVLITASQLRKRYIFLLGAASLVAYLFTTYFSASQDGVIPGTEQVTQITMFILFTALVAAQSYYVAYIIRKKDEEELQLKDQFVYTTAHDLRAPFALIRLLAEKYEKRSPQTVVQLREDMQLINENISSASQLLEDLLNLAKGENVPLNIVPTEITEVVAHVIDHWKFAIHKKNIRLEYIHDETRIVMADKQKLSFILDNVIGNAVKYNRQNGSVRIWHNTEGDMLLTMIEDTGHGINEENIAKLFSPYFRELKDATIPGTGLGLYSTKKFVEQLDGTISVSSMTGGTRFTIALPLGKIASETENDVSGSSQQ